MMNKKRAARTRLILTIIALFFFLLAFVFLVIYLLRDEMPAGSGYIQEGYSVSDSSSANDSGGGDDSVPETDPVPDSVSDSEISSAAEKTPAPVLDSSQGTREEADALQRERAAQNAEPGIVISGRTKISAVAGMDVIEGINLENAPENEGSYYISYELRLPDESSGQYEVLFQTDMISPGNVIPDVKLSRALEAGEYQCVLRAQPYYMDSLGATNNADMDVVLEVR